MTAVALVFFLPLLIDSGGNADAQASTLILRALATGDIKLSDWWHMFVKELLVASALGLTMAAVASVIGFFRGGMKIGLVVAISMVLIVIASSLIGMLMPFVLQKFGRDPATASAPLVTSIADICGVLIYFSLASVMI
ncbi:MAG: magnesium transporter, partial [Chitinispirillia bacterium]|nr:magnesium transporter [Chitinispirillia bacterium]